jgi:enoyl-[acyl-carrier protein] reductase II
VQRSDRDTEPVCGRGWGEVVVGEMFFDVGDGGADVFRRSERPVTGYSVLGDEKMEMRRFSNIVPMRDATTGDLEEMPLLAGQGVGLVGAVSPAAQVVAELTADARARLSAGNR